MENKIEYGEVTTKKHGKMWVAITMTTKPIKTEMFMYGKTEEIAKEKLTLFLNNEPYKHLDN